MFVRSQGQGFLAIGHQVGAQDGTDAGFLSGLLKLYRAVHPIGIGTGERREPALHGGSDQRLGTRGADAEGKMGVDVEMHVECVVP